MKWVRDTQLGLVFVCIWQKALQLLYIDELLDKVRKKFSAAFKDQLQSFELGSSFEFSDHCSMPHLSGRFHHSHLRPILLIARSHILSMDRRFSSPLVYKVVHGRTRGHEL